jgi:murein DD-endopeptidase MepM/ murein hydrolase activator NlpD
MQRTSTHRSTDRPNSARHGRERTTRTVRELLLCSAGALLVSSCATLSEQPWYGDVHATASTVATTVKKDAAVGARAASTAAASTYDRMQHYLAEKDVLRTFTDAGEHSEQEVLDLLHRKRLVVPPSGARRPTAPSPSGTGSAGNAGSAASAGGGVTTALPAQYQGQLRWPLDAGIVSSEYGPRKGEVHKGLDIAADKGEPVYAAADGEVIYAGDGLRGYGNVVIIQHDRHVTTLYAHNSSLKVAQGQHVAKGTLIALLGSTGRSTGPHVHFEVRRDDSAVSPRSVLPKSMLAEAGGPAATHPSSQPAVARGH